MAGGLGVGARATPSPPRMETKKPFPLWGLGFFDCHSLLSLVRQADERDIHGAYGGDVEANPVTVTMSGTQIAICAGEFLLVALAFLSGDCAPIALGVTLERRVDVFRQQHVSGI